MHINIGWEALRFRITLFPTNFPETQVTQNHINSNQEQPENYK